MMSLGRRHPLRRAGLAALLGLAAMAAGAQGSAAPVRVGLSSALSGAHAPYGQGLLQGVRLALAAINQGGGIDGRPVELLSLDDGGDPARAQANTQQLLAAGVVALTGFHGSRTVAAVLPALAQSGVPMIGAASSAESLRVPPQRLLFHLRAGAGDEIGALVYHFDTLGLQRMGVLAQPDALGRSGLDTLRLELARLAMRPVGLESLPERFGEPELEAAVQRLCATTPDAALLALDARWVVSALRMARGAGCGHTHFAVLSETGAALVPPTGASPAQGLTVVQVLPHPANVAHPLVAAYHKALGRDAAQPSYASLEGWLYGRVIGELLRGCARRIGPACLAETLEARPPELPGWKLRFGAQERRGSRFAEMTLLDAQGRLRR